MLDTMLLCNLVKEYIEKHWGLDTLIANTYDVIVIWPVALGDLGIE